MKGLDLLLAMFARLSPEKQEEVRVAMLKKQREIGRERLNQIGEYLTP